MLHCAFATKACVRLASRVTSAAFASRAQEKWEDPNVHYNAQHAAAPAAPASRRRPGNQGIAGRKKGDAGRCSNCGETGHYKSRYVRTLTVSLNLQLVPHTALTSVECPCLECTRMYGVPRAPWLTAGPGTHVA
jgi:hypothetical protein